MSSSRATALRRLVVFRVDGSPTLGAGHIRRCAILAEGLARSGWRVAFACRVQPDAAQLLDAIETFEMQDVGEVDDPDLLRRTWPDGCELLVVDHYQLDKRFEYGCRGWARRILVIDDLANRSHDCDALVDQTPGRDGRAYQKMVNPDCTLFVGPAYALLDPPFAVARKRFRREFGRIRRLLVSFGYSDLFGVTAMTLEGILLSGVDAAVDIVFGIAPPDIGRVRDLASRLSPISKVHINTRDMASLIMRADLAIGAGGVSALERCCLGLPSLIVTMAENQQGNTDALMSRGAALALGYFRNINPAMIARELRTISNDRNMRETVSVSAAQVTDGYGVDRIVQYCSALAA